LEDIPTGLKPISHSSCLVSISSDSVRQVPTMSEFVVITDLVELKSYKLENTQSFTWNTSSCNRAIPTELHYFIPNAVPSYNTSIFTARQHSQLCKSAVL